MKFLTQEDTIQRIKATNINHDSSRAFAFHDEETNLAYDWHHHDSHQLLYAIHGIMHLETINFRYLLPPQRAVWIPARVSHRTWLNQVEAVSVFFPHSWISDPAGKVRVLAASPVMREMMLYAIRWPPNRPEPDALADSYFETLALLCREWMSREMPFHLPCSTVPALARAMDYAQANLAEANIAGACRAAAMSERTFRRHFQQAVGMGWLQYLVHSRLMHAMALLGEPGLRIADVADRVGFASLGSFAKAFKDFSGDSPSQYRRALMLAHQDCPDAGQAHPRPWAKISAESQPG